MTAAGWYPDPGDSGRERFWDGQSWTPAVRDVELSQPHPPLASSLATERRRINMALIAALVVVAVLLIVGLVALFSADSSHTQPSNVAETPENTVVDGNSDEWLSRLCQPGKYMDGGVGFPEALSEGICLASSGPIAVGTFTSKFSADNAAAMRRPEPGLGYAIGVDHTGTVWLFLGQRRGLAPLREFGFDIRCHDKRMPPDAALDDPSC